MSYNIQFLPQAKKEWDKLDSSLKEYFKKKLKKIQVNPCVQANALRNMTNCYKIKLRGAGYRLVYEVDEGIITVYVISVGEKRFTESL